jgi:hypothetical protein
MATQKFMGRGQLIDRLTAQVGSRDMALDILKKRGHVNAKGELTPEGRKRDMMTAEERAKDRAAKATKRSPEQFTYNPKTNSATLRRR